MYSITIEQLSEKIDVSIEDIVQCLQYCNFMTQNEQFRKHCIDNFWVKPFDSRDETWLITELGEQFFTQIINITLGFIDKTEQSDSKIEQKVNKKEDKTIENLEKEIKRLKDMLEKQSLSNNIDVAKTDKDNVLQAWISKKSKSNNSCNPFLL